MVVKLILFAVATDFAMSTIFSSLSVLASIQLLRRRGRFYCRGAGEVLPSAAGVVQSDEQMLRVLDELTLQAGGQMGQRGEVPQIP